MCGPPAVPLNAKVKTVSGGDLLGISEATYECDSGYELFGPAKVRCDARKGWERELPFCGRLNFYLFYFQNGNFVLYLDFPK